MPTARVFKSGNSQAIRLPKEFQVDCKELEIFQIGDSLVLTKKQGSTLGDALNILHSMDFADFLLAERSKDIPQEREGFDE